MNERPTIVLPLKSVAEERWRAFSDLEPIICDLDRMARLAGKEINDMLDAARGEQGDLIELSVFAVQQLVRQVADLKKEYYRGFGETGDAA